MAGNVKSAQTITAVFSTSSPTTGAAINADSLPTGTLYVNGTANGATVTVTNIDTGRYKAALTLPTLTAGDVVDLSISATVGTIAGKAVVWSAIGDTKRVSDLNDAAAVSAAAIRSEIDSNSTKLDVATSTRASATDYTTARAVKLDNLDVAVSTRNSTTPLSAAQVENAVWDATATSHTTSGSMGAKEANLDATVSSRLATSGYTTPPTVVQTRQEMDSNSTKLANLDAAITTRATPAQILLTPANLIKTNASNQVEASSVQGSVTGSVASVTGAVGSVTGNVGGNVTGSVASVTAGVTVTTNNDKTGYTASTVSDKTGYSLSAGGVQAIWDALTSALSTAGSIGKRIVDNLDTNVGSRLATSGYTAPSTPPTVVEIRTELDTNSTKLANLDATVSSRLASGPVTVGTNSDKTGYSLSAAGVQAVWDALTSALITTGSIGKWITDKLDVAVSSRNSTTPPTVAAIRSEIDTNSTKLDAAVSTRASAVDYTTARALKLDNLDAAITSRLAATDYTAPPTPPTVVQIRTELDTNSTKLTRLDTTVSSRLAAVDYAPSDPAPTVEEITGAVWSEPIPGSYTSSQAGGKLNALGNAADPLLNLVPGGYASGTAGAALGRLVGASVSLTAPVISSGNVQIMRGDSYYSADARALIWSITGLPTIVLTGAVTTFKAKNIASILTKTNSTTPGVTASYSGGILTLTVELSAADTDSLNATTSANPYAFDIETAFTNGHVETWVSGTMTVVKDVR